MLKVSNSFLSTVLKSNVTGISPAWSLFILHPSHQPQLHSQSLFYQVLACPATCCCLATVSCYGALLALRPPVHRRSPVNFTTSTQHPFVCLTLTIQHLSQVTVSLLFDYLLKSGSPLHYSLLENKCPILWSFILLYFSVYNCASHLASSAQ